MPAERMPRKAHARDPGSLLTRQIAELAGSQSHVSVQRERPWASITFAGTRYCLTIDLEGETNPEEWQKLAELLPDHEFAIPGHFVADILVTEQSEKRMGVEALLIFDPVQPPRSH